MIPQSSELWQAIVLGIGLLAVGFLVFRDFMMSWLRRRREAKAAIKANAMLMQQLRQSRPSNRFPTK